MTRSKRDELRRLLAKATPGPWVNEGRRGGYNMEAGWSGIHIDKESLVGTPELGMFAKGADAALVVAAANALPELLDEIEALHDEAARAVVAATVEHSRLRERAEKAEARAAALEDELSDTGDVHMAIRLMERDELASLRRLEAASVRCEDASHAYWQAAATSGHAAAAAFEKELADAEDEWKAIVAERRAARNPGGGEK